MSTNNRSKSRGSQVDQYGFIVGKARSQGSYDAGTTGNDNASSYNVSKMYEQRNKQREKKWILMLSDKQWQEYITKKQRKLRDRCRKGIPQSCRGKAWFYLTGASRVKQVRQATLENLKTQNPDAKWKELIERDLTRTLPEHSVFSEENGPGQKALYKVLTCYSIYNPKIGYCQALSPITAVLILYMDWEDAFWVLTRIADVYMVDYFSEGMRGIQLDCLIFMDLMKVFLPRECTILVKRSIDPILFLQQWFFCLFSRTLPWNIVMRVWDVYFFEGKWCLFRIALTMVKIILRDVISNPDQYDMNDILIRMTKFDFSNLNEEKFLEESHKIKIDSQSRRKISEYNSKLLDKQSARISSGSTRKKSTKNESLLSLGRLGKIFPNRNKAEQSREYSPSKAKSSQRLSKTPESKTPERDTLEHLFQASMSKDSTNEFNTSEESATEVIPVPKTPSSLGGGEHVQVQATKSQPTKAIHHKPGRASIAKTLPEVQN